MQSTLINFKSPISRRNRFDAICGLQGRSRSSILNDLMETYISTQGPILASKAEEIAKTDNAISASRSLMSFREFLNHEEDAPLPIGYKDD